MWYEEKARTISLGAGPHANSIHLLLSSDVVHEISPHHLSLDSFVQLHINDPTSIDICRTSVFVIFRQRTELVRSDNEFMRGFLRVISSLISFPRPT